MRSLGWEDTLEKKMATHYSILTWEIPWIEEAGGLSPGGCKRVRHDLVTKQQLYTYIYFPYIYGNDVIGPGLLS